MPKKIAPSAAKLEAAIMDKVNSGEIKMKPRWYFVLGSLLMASGLVGLSIVLIYALNLTFFLLRSHGPMAQWRFEQILLSFPWWVPVLTIGGIGLGAWLLKKYDFSYRKNFWGVAIGILLVITVSAYLLDVLGLSDQWFHRGGMRRMHQGQQNQGEFPQPFRNEGKNGRMMDL